jgi:hypothetical protein
VKDGGRSRPRVRSVARFSPRRSLAFTSPGWPGATSPDSPMRPRGTCRRVLPAGLRRGGRWPPPGACAQPGQRMRPTEHTGRSRPTRPASTESRAGSGRLGRARSDRAWADEQATSFAQHQSAARARRGGSREARAGAPAAACDRDCVHGNYAGVFLVVVGGALLALLVMGRRAGRTLARDIWGRMRLLRWIGVAIAIVVALTLAGVIPGR